MGAVATLAGGKGPKAPTTRRNLMAGLLEPERLRLRLGPLVDPVWTAFPRDFETTKRDVAEWSKDRLAARIAEARAMIATEAEWPAAELDKACDALRSAAETRADDRQAEVIAAILVDGFPNARPASPEGYVDALMWAIADENAHPVRETRYGTVDRRLSVNALAAATVAAWKTLTFAPAPSEFLGLCQKSRERFVDAHARVDGFRIWRPTVRWFLEDHDGLAPLPDDTDWSDPDALPF